MHETTTPRGAARPIALAVAAATAALTLLAAAATAETVPEDAAPPAPAAPALQAALPPVHATPSRFDAGRSGELRAGTALPGASTPWTAPSPAEGWIWAPVDAAAEGTLPVPAAAGTDGHLLAPAVPGAYRLARPDGTAADADGATLFVLVPFAAKERGRVGTYSLGTWPGEGSSSAPYPLPEGFVRVTQALATARVSTHLELGGFKTKNQWEVWPKYVALDLRLVDKLELITADLRGQGLPGSRIFIMSGFRTPSYNAQEVGPGGRAQYSRHQYGDAADMWVDDDRDGRLDDLNRDGRCDTADVKVMLAAQERVEKRWPELLGGGGVYKATSAHGPFLHVDVRGNRARWGAL